MPGASAFLILAALAASCASARAEEVVSATITIRNDCFEPAELHVPAEKRIRAAAGGASKDQEKLAPHFSHPFDPAAESEPNRQRVEPSWLAVPFPHIANSSAAV
jgi:hypothetical protein